MTAEQPEYGHWILGLLVPTEAADLVGESPGFTPVRILADDEQERLHTAHEDLTAYNLGRLVAPFHTAGRDFFEAATAGLTSGGITRSDFDAITRLSTSFSSALSSLTGSQKRVRAAAARAGKESTRRLDEEFQQLRRDNIHFLTI